jgi:glyoxylate reductase
MVTRKLPAAVEARLVGDYEAHLNPDDGQLDHGALVARAQGMDALLICATERFDKELIDALPGSVRAIATFSVGFEHIDLEAAAARGIVVTNTPDVLTNATADIAMLLLLGAARRAGEAEAAIRNNAWERWTPTGMLGVHVTGKRLGIFGMGRIGRAMAQRARGFEMDIHYCNRSRLPPELEGDAIYHDQPEDLLPVSQFLSLHCPVTPETRYFLDDERIALLPDGAIVVNSARGDVVKDEDLIAALKSGKLAAAGLDVFSGEPEINPAYRTLANTFLFPHLGSATLETREAMGFTCLDNLDAFFAGKPVPHALT